MNGRIMKSQFTIFSFGIVVSDKKKNSNEIEVFPIEFNTEYSGDPTENRDVETKITNELEDKEDKKIKVDNTILASWIPIGQSNRLSSPDVCNGETVLIYRYEESNMFYWDTCFNETDLRKKEHMLIGCSNTDDIEEILTSSNTYYSLIDTREKNVILMHVSDNDGEHTTYDIHIDTKKGVFTMEDGKGNLVQIDSSKDEVNITTNEKVNIKTTEVNVDCTTYNLNCDDAHITASTLDIIADTTLFGKFEHTGNYTHTGTAKRMGALQQYGMVTAVPPIPTTSTLAQN